MEIGEIVLSLLDFVPPYWFDVLVHALAKGLSLCPKQSNLKSAAGHVPPRRGTASFPPRRNGF